MFKNKIKAAIIVEDKEGNSVTFLDKKDCKTLKKTKQYLKYFVEKRGDIFEERKDGIIIIKSEKSSQIHYEGMIREALMH